MPRSTQHNRRGKGEVLRPSNKGDRIRELLKVQLQTFPQKELYPEEVGHWEADLDPFPLPAIEWAFENWRRNGRRFPVYGDILDYCIVWEPSSDTKYRPGCSAECKAQHYRGYSETDVKILNQLVTTAVLANGRPKDQKLSDEEIEELLSQLDKKRGRIPDWRKTA